MVTFPFRFDTLQPVQLSLAPTRTPVPADDFPIRIHAADGAWTLEYASGLQLQARPVWPALKEPGAWVRETIEQNANYRWDCWTQADKHWGRRVEIRRDRLGQVVLVAHLQRRGAEGHWAPPFGWTLTTVANTADPQATAGNNISNEEDLPRLHSFAAGQPYEWLFDDGGYRVAHPAAPWKQRGALFLGRGQHGEPIYRYLRSAGADRVPMQPYAWRQAELVVSPTAVALPTATLMSPHEVQFDWRNWDALYDIGPPVKLAEEPQLAKLLAYHHAATAASAAVGHDWGNVTLYFDGKAHGGILGMNRLNHCPAIFFEAMRTGDRRLMETAVAWCNNFHDLTIWWGPEPTGGTRYPDIRRMGNSPPEDDSTFMWRGDQSNHFCTKGYDSFLLAYEQTGDPRMKQALEAQAAYAMEHVHAGDGECRNIGDVADFVHLYEFTGDKNFLDQALRLFRELRPKLMPNHLFSQSGKPIVADVHYIDEDEEGMKYPFAKPYIIGYALAGCPRLARYAADEPLLKEMVRAVADFLAQSQDPLGGWRYPHPKSSRMIAGQAMEHAWQLTQASALVGAKPEYLDAIERTLRQRLWLWKKSGKIFRNLHGWEISTGRIKQRQEIYGLYQRPADRDSSRDYTEGRVELGVCSPEGLVYFPGVLRFYLQHRVASRLLSLPKKGSPLEQVVSRVGSSDLVK